MRTLLLFGLMAIAPRSASAQIPVLRRSDVVFMYQASPAVYAAYGATVLAWGGTPKPESLEQAKGIKFFGSVGMVTEFARYYERFPQTYEQGLCRDLQGQPFKVPWLTDHQHKGVPFWWCCTRQPLFRQYLSERVADTVKAGAYGVHIDDHLGTAGALWNGGGCFCSRCIAEFCDFLKHQPPRELAPLEIKAPADYDFAAVLRQWLAEKPGRKVQDHPVWPRWRVYQLQGAAAFMSNLRALAARTAGHPVPMGANACLLWGPHLNDYKSLDLFSAEIEHHASAKAFSDSPLCAYRLADAVGRPLAATGSGGDWAFIKEHDLPGLVQGWIALGYAAGHSLMAPVRQWCYTPEKGTHWYEGPQEKFAPLYRFVRENSALFDGYDNHADLTIAVAYRTFDRNRDKVIELCNRLAAAHISYQLALGVDEIVDHPLPASVLRRARKVLVLDAHDFRPADRRLLDRLASKQRCASLEDALTRVVPAVRLQSDAQVRIFPRVRPGAAVIHLVNWSYYPDKDEVAKWENVSLGVDFKALGLRHVHSAKLFSPGAEPVPLSWRNNQLRLPQFGLWGVVQLE